MRTDVTFESGGVSCAAWWYEPEGGATGPAPVVVLGIGLGSVKEMGMDRYARAFAAEGYAALAFDYRGFGESGGQPRQVIDVAMQLDDWRAAIEFARHQPGVDSDRVVVWGTSFGGGHAIRLAAEAPPGVVAALAQCPFTDGVASALAMGPISSLRVGPLAARDLWAARTGRPPVMVATAGPPHSAGLMTARDAESGFLDLVPPGTSTFQNQVAARIGLRIMAYRPGRSASSIRMPVWVGICDQDTVAPPRRTARLMAKAPQAEVHHYDTGHFAIYGEPWVGRVIEGQIAFLHRVVGAAGIEPATSAL